MLNTFEQDAITGLTVKEIELLAKKIGFSVDKHFLESKQYFTERLLSKD